jgi:enoyl-CoA hydratase
MEMAMTTEPVTYELDGRIATIAIDDGKVNAFSIPTLRALHAALDRAERDNAVIVLTGREGYFSAGFDLKVFAAGADPVLEMLNLGATLAERIFSFPTPVVAACSGHAVAAATFVLLAADARIGTDGPFRVGLNEVKIGLTLPWFVVELARYRLSPAGFDTAVVNAKMHDPHEATTVGFLDRVVPAEELRAASLDTARELAELNPAAHAATKLRARGHTLEAMRSAIASELTVEGLSGAQPPE